jgi:hypothetical protein
MTSRTLTPRIWSHPAVLDLGVFDPEHLESELIKAGVNVLAVVQSFDPEEKRIQFNFPSKLTEYMTFGLPILIVAPEYASAALWVRTEGQEAVAALITRAEPEAFLQTLTRLKLAQARQNLAKSMGQIARFYSPEVLNRRFQNALLEAIKV